MRQSLASFCRQYSRLNLLNEWDAERNLPLTPETVTHGAHHKIWLPDIRRWSRSGMRRRICQRSPQRLLPAASGWSGGNAHRATVGGPRFGLAFLDVAAPCAPGDW